MHHRLWSSIRFWARVLVRVLRYCLGLRRLVLVLPYPVYTGVQACVACTRPRTRGSDCYAVVDWCFLDLWCMGYCSQACAQADAEAHHLKVAKDPMARRAAERRVVLGTDGHDRLKVALLPPDADPESWPGDEGDFEAYTIRSPREAAHYARRIRKVVGWRRF